MPELIRRFEPFRPLQGLAGSATAAEERQAGGLTVEGRAVTDGSDFARGEESCEGWGAEA